MLQNQIAVLWLQETEIEKTFDKNLLRIPGFNLELENNSSLSLVGYFISHKLNYKRNLGASLKSSDYYWPEPEPEPVAIRDGP